MKFLLPFLLLLTFLVNCLHAQTTLWVSKGGTGSAPCMDATNPCPTINTAIAVANATPATIDRINVLPGQYIEQINITTPVELRGVTNIGGNLPIAPDLSNRNQRGSESELVFTQTVIPPQQPSNNITIAAGLNNVTIEGFKLSTDITYDAGNLSAAAPLIQFAAGTYNTIIIRRNIYHGDSDFGGEAPYIGQRPLVLLPTTTTIENLQVIENRIYGLNMLPVPALGLNGNQISGHIQGNIIGGNIPGFQANELQVGSGIELSMATNFRIYQNRFQNLVRSAVDLKSTTGTAGLDTVKIELNTFEQANQSDDPETGSIILRPNTDPANGNGQGTFNFNGDSVLVQRNEFLANARYAISIPTAHNRNFANATDVVKIKIVENNFSGNTGTIQADIFLGTDNPNSAGLIDANANWWGSNAAPTTDIRGGANTIKSVSQTIWLTNNTDINGAATGFVSNKTTTFNTAAQLNEAFNSIPLNWTLDLPNLPYTTSPTVVRSFVLNPLVNNIVLPGIILNGADAVMSLNKSIQIKSGTTISFQQGKIALGSNNLRMLGTATANSALPGNTNSFIITDGIGQLIQESVSSTKAGVFPIGRNTSSYTPATVTIPAGTSGAFTFAARAEDIDPVVGLRDNTNTSTFNVVGVLWQIDNQTGGNPNAQLTLQWNANDELIDFISDGNRLSYISKFDGSRWVNLEWPVTEAAVVSANVWKRTVAGINSFSPFVIAGDDAPLPVDLISFKAETDNKEVLLTWNTASEKNNAYFAIERSADSKTFEEIGKVEGNGTKTILSSYTFTDARIVESGASLLYYRLKQVDTDGKFKYSKVASVLLENAAVAIYPNPTDRMLTISAPGQTEVQIVNIQGQVVLQKNFTFTTELDVTNLAKGIYIVKLLHKDKVTTQKVSVY